MTVTPGPRRTSMRCAGCSSAPSAPAARVAPHSPTCRRRPEQLRLARGDRPDVGGAREVAGHRGDLGDHPDAWTDEPTQIRDLARNIEAELDDRDLMCRLLTEEGQ